MTQKTIRQSGVLRRGSKTAADHGGFWRAVLSTKQVKQYVDGRVPCSIQRDAGVIHQAALRQVHDIGRDVLRREIHDELRERRFSFSHVGPPFFLSGVVAGAPYGRDSLRLT